MNKFNASRMRELALSPSSQPTTILLLGRGRSADTVLSSFEANQVSFYMYCLPSLLNIVCYVPIIVLALHAFGPVARRQIHEHDI